MEKKRRRQNYIWVIILTLCSLTIVIFPTVFSRSISADFSKHMLAQRKSSISKMVHLTYNSVEPIIMKLKSGDLNRSEAEKMIADRLRTMVYEDEFGENYIFMSTYEGVMLVQPFERQKEGTSQWLLKDAKGRYIMQALAGAAKIKPEGSFVTYDYYPPNRTKAEEKLSYVMGIPEIGAYIGTGMYVESTYSKIKDIIVKQEYGYLALTITILIALLIYAQMLLKSNHRLRKEIQERAYAENNIRTIFDTIHDAIIIHDQAGNVLQTNKQMCIMYGISESDVTNYNIKDLTEDALNTGQMLMQLEERLKHTHYLIFEWKAKKPIEQTIMDVEVAMRMTQWSGQTVYVAAVRDISDRKKTESDLKDSELRYKTLYQAANDAIFILDENGIFVECNEKTEQLFGYSKEELIGMSVIDISSETQINGKHSMALAYDKILRTYGGEPQYFEWLHTHKNGSVFFADVSLNKVELKNKAYVQAIVRDIAERKQYEEKIKYLAYYDFLTGLPNRISMMNEIQEKLDGNNSGNYFGAVYFLDIDNFKMVNDTFGHSFGDKVLIEAAEKLKELSSEQITISRIGGDEFILLLSGCKDEAYIETLAENILASLKAPIVVNGNKFYLTCSIGIAVYPKDGRTVEEILKYADLAMYKAKTQGKNNYVFYNNTMGIDLTEKTELETCLRDALSKNEFVLYYQPQVDTKQGSIIGLEALIRWDNPIYGFVQPDRFIPIVEEMGLIYDIGKWVIKSSFSYARKFMDTDICVSCNVSSIQLMQSSFVQDVIEIFDQCELKKGSVALEITESSLVKSFGEISEKLISLRAHGINIHLDDFGTGYSSLNYLKNLPIDTVKIDKSFIDDIIFDGVERRIVSSIVSLAHEIGLKVIAEGVEIKEQMNYLALCNCNAIQGYLISKPIPEAEIANLLQAY